MIDNELPALLKIASELKARLALIPYDGTPEIKETPSGSYIYIRKKF